jgi:hypothetical protein
MIVQVSGMRHKNESGIRVIHWCKIYLIVRCEIFYSDHVTGGRSGVGKYTIRNGDISIGTIVRTVYMGLKICFYCIGSGTGKNVDRTVGI